MGEVKELRRALAKNIDCGEIGVVVAELFDSREKLVVVLGLVRQGFKRLRCRRRAFCASETGLLLRGQSKAPANVNEDLFAITGDRPGSDLVLVRLADTDELASDDAVVENRVDRRDILRAHVPYCRCDRTLLTSVSLLIVPQVPAGVIFDFAVPSESSIS